MNEFPNIFIGLKYKNIFTNKYICQEIFEYSNIFHLLSTIIFKGFSPHWLVLNLFLIIIGIDTRSKRGKLVLKIFVWGNLYFNFNLI